MGVAAGQPHTLVTELKTAGGLQVAHFLTAALKAPVLQWHVAVAVSKVKPGGQQTQVLVGAL